MVYISLSEGTTPDTGSRTLYPEVQFSKYVLHFISSDTTLQAPADRTVTEGNTVSQQLHPGTWTISVKGYKEDRVLAEGEETVEVVADTPQNISIAVTRPSDGKGTFSYTLAYSDDFLSLPGAKGLLTLSRLEVVDAPIKQELSFSREGDMGSINCSSGFYILRITIDAGTDANLKTVVRTETVHIYPDEVTQGVYSFSQDDFMSLMLGGTVSISLDGVWCNRIYAYSDEGYEHLIGDTTVDASAKWLMPVESYEEASTIYFRGSFAKDPGLRLYVGNIPAPMDNKTDIVLGDSSMYRSLSSGWYESTLAEGTIHYYYFYADAGTPYSIKWNDSRDGSGKTGDIKVSAFWGDSQDLFTGADDGYTTPQLVNVQSSGYVILKVERGSRDGNYGIQVRSNAKTITQFSFTELGMNGLIDESEKTITLIMPYGTTDITNLIPVVTHTGVSYSPQGAQDFTSPQQYTVTAEDGTTQVYTVKVSGKAGVSISGPSLADETIPGFPTAPLSLSKNPSGTVSMSQTISISDTTYSQYQWYVNNHLKTADTNSSGRVLTLNPLEYSVGKHRVSLVVYKNGVPYSNEQTFTVTLLSETKAVTGFSFTSPQETGVIDEATKTITITVPFGTDITNLTPVVTHTGAAYSPPGAQDFTSPQQYTVTAEDGTTQVYTVTVKVSGKAGVSINGPSLVDETISGFPTAPLSLSKNPSGTVSMSQTISISDTTYSQYQWYVDNRLKTADTNSSGTSFTLNAAEYAIGMHTLVLIVYKNGIPYSQEQGFTISN
jgi:hypothetical protein